MEHQCSKCYRSTWRGLPPQWLTLAVWLTSVGQRDKVLFNAIRVLTSSTVLHPRVTQSYEIGLFDYLLPSFTDLWCSDQMSCSTIIPNGCSGASFRVQQSSFTSIRTICSRPSSIIRFCNLFCQSQYFYS